MSADEGVYRAHVVGPADYIPRYGERRLRVNEDIGWVEQNLHYNALMTFITDLWRRTSHKVVKLEEFIICL